jgi:hypothetical protein
MQVAIRDGSDQFFGRRAAQLLMLGAKASFRISWHFLPLWDQPGSEPISWKKAMIGLNRPGDTFSSTDTLAQRGCSFLHALYQ